VLAALVACRQGGEDASRAMLHTVTRDDLVVTVRERGEIEAARDTRISSELEGRATLIYLIPEGTVVVAGDKLAELDVSAIEEKRASQAISVAKAQALLEQARKNVEIVEKELTAATRTAETRLAIAKLRHDKFIGQDAKQSTAQSAEGTNADMIGRLRELLDEETAAAGSIGVRAHLLQRVLAVLGSEERLGLQMGEMANLILQQIDKISLARADLELAEDTLFHSRKLEERGFLTSNELERDEISYKRQLSAQTVAWNDLTLLVNYTVRETLMVLQLEVENAQLNLESVQAANDARRVREDAELKSIEAEFGLAKDQLATWDRQIRNGVLRAPGPGLVVYGRFDWDEPVYEGMEIRERQELIILPDVTSMVARLRVPEAQIGRLAVGQPASLFVDAFPGRSFTGRVQYVSALPDPSPSSQSLKVYVAKVLIDGTNEHGDLRPGMNGTVTIEVGTIPDVVNVPLPALERRGDRHFVWKVTPGGPVATEVELGGNNLTHVEVIAGLAEGDQIHLVRPPGAQLPGAEDQPEPPESGLEAARAEGARAPAGGGSK
jgi:HlyD family secretion protein